MKCHSCPHSDAILRGEFDSKPWNETPCAACKLSEDTFYTVPLDEEHPPMPVGDPAFERTKSSVPLNAHMPVDVLAQFVEALMHLPAEQRDVVAWRFQCMPYKEIARRQGSSIQLAEMRHKIAMRDFPILRKLFPEKVAKRHRRLCRK